MAPGRNEEQASDHDTALDQHVVYFLRHHPEFYNQHTISRMRPGCYIIDGREITVEWHYGEHGEEGYLVAVDGPLRQPFADYAQGTEENAKFDNEKLPRSNLQQIPKERQLSFGDMHQVVSRLEAMKIAKEQALVREMAAGYTKEGHAVPQSELMKRYQKTIDQKLGSRNRRPNQTTTPAPPASAPVPVAVTPRGEREEAPTPLKTHGSPVYCTNHNATEKRKKIAPHEGECVACKTIVQTNYADFKLCPSCSQQKNCCMCCGESVACREQPRAQPTPPPPPAATREQPRGHPANPTPLFCSNHNSTERRKKVAPQRLECTTCGEIVQTNYAEFTVCHACSQRDNRCVCCGDNVGGGPPKSKGQVTPAFCINHKEKRDKTKPRNVECTSCQVSIQTNYVDFALCAPCSQAEQRCVCCGSSTCAAMPSTAQVPGTVNLHQPALPAEGYGNGVGFPNLGIGQLQGWPIFNQPTTTNQIFSSQNPMASQCNMVHNPMASQNVFASANPMASINNMVSQRAF